MITFGNWTSSELIGLHGFLWGGRILMEPKVSEQRDKQSSATKTWWKSDRFSFRCAEEYKAVRLQAEATKDILWKLDCCNIPQLRTVLCQHSLLGRENLPALVKAPFARGPFQSKRGHESFREDHLTQKTHVFHYRPQANVKFPTITFFVKIRNTNNNIQKTFVKQTDHPNKMTWQKADIFEWNKWNWKAFVSRGAI